LHKTIGSPNIIALDALRTIGVKGDGSGKQSGIGGAGG
jgi:hypothetical protein